MQKAHDRRPEKTHFNGWLAHRGPLHTYAWRVRWCVLTESGFADYRTEGLGERLTHVVFGPETRVSAIASKDAPGESIKYRKERPYSFVLDLAPSAGPKRKLAYYDAGTAKVLASWLAGFRNAGVTVNDGPTANARPTINAGPTVVQADEASTSPAAKTPKVCPKQASGRGAGQEADQCENVFRFSRKLTQRRPGTLDEYFDVDREILGEGAYGSVRKGVDRSTGAIRVVKSIDKEKLPDAEAFEEEVQIQQALDHPNIVKLYEVFKDAKRYYLVLEICTGGELFDRIVEQAELNDGHPFDAACAAKYMLQILGGVCYMHSQKYAHRDLKPENFMLQNKSATSCIKIIDFGLAKRCEPNKGMSTPVGTPFYIAPEVVSCGGANGAKVYGEKCDVWSCGVVAYILLCGRPPFSGRTDNEIFNKVRGGAYSFPSPDWDGISSSAKNFVAMAMTFNPKMRPSASDLLKHDWLTKADVSSGRLTRDFAGRLKSFRSASKIEKIALTFIAHTLREEEIKELKEMFIALDVNKDGTLTAREISTALRQKGVEPPPDLHQALCSIDTDGSGVIDYTEFIAATIASQVHMTEEVLWNTFRMFDKDMSGEITVEELGQVLNCEDEAVQKAIIQEVDANKDGKICFEEFTMLMRRNKPGPAPSMMQ